MWERVSRRDLARRVLGGLARAHAPRLCTGTALTGVSGVSFAGVPPGACFRLGPRPRRCRRGGLARQRGGGVVPPCTRSGFRAFAPPRGWARWGDGVAGLPAVTLERLRGMPARGLVSARGPGLGGGARGRSCRSRARWMGSGGRGVRPSGPFADPSPRAGWINRGGSRIREGPLARRGRGSYGRRGPGVSERQGPDPGVLAGRVRAAGCRGEVAYGVLAPARARASLWS